MIMVPIFFLLSIATPLFGWSESSFEIFDALAIDNKPAQYSYILKLKMPNSITKIPPLSCYCMGEQFDFDTDFCIIPSNSQRLHFSLFITQADYPPRAKIEKKSIRYLERIADKPCRLFSCSLHQDPAQEAQSWDIQEEDIKKLPLRIPDDAIILLLPPEYIEKLETPKETKVTKIGSKNFIHLPTVILSSKVKQAQLDEEANKSHLASLDLKMSHRKSDPAISEIIKAGQSVKISMRTACR